LPFGTSRDLRETAKALLYVFLMVSVIGMFFLIRNLDQPRELAVSTDEMDQSVFALGISQFNNKQPMVTSVALRGSINEYDSRWMVTIFMAKTLTAPLEDRLILILPAMASNIIGPPSVNLTIDQKQYAKVVYIPVKMDGSANTGWTEIYFNWKGFLKPIGVGRWAFFFEWRGSHYIYDKEYGAGFFNVVLYGLQNEMVQFKISLMLDRPLKFDSRPGSWASENSAHFFRDSYNLAFCASEKVVNTETRLTMDTAMDLIKALIGGAVLLMAGEFWRTLRNKTEGNPTRGTFQKGGDVPESTAHDSVIIR